jgi:uncharacterized protein (TIGR00369 family)
MTSPFVAGDPIDAAPREVLRAFMEEHIPFNKHLGIQLRDARRGFVHGVLPFRPELVGNPFKPALHGGVLSAFADAVGGCSVFTMIEPGWSCSTIDLRIDYLRPGRLEELNAESTILRVGARVAVASITIYQSEKASPIAVAMAVYSVKKASS